MGPRAQIRLMACCLLLSSSLFAARINGKVTNGTTNKPAVADDVVLLSLAGGMQETARTKTGAKGEFSLDVTDPGTQHLIRVGHQGVNYFQPVRPGSSSLDVTVFDAASKIDNLIGEGRVIRLQTVGKELEVSEMYYLSNESKPPRTWKADHTFEITLPEGAKIEEGLAAGPGGMPVNSSPVPIGIKNHYAFVYPLRPGRSRLQVVYKMPYGGAQDFSITPNIPLSELGVMLPKSMNFTSSGDTFAPAGEEAGMTVYVAKSLAPDKAVSFSITGEGSVPREAQGNTGGNTGGPASNAPGGGLGAPIGSPDPLSGSRWYVLGGVFAVMAGFGLWMMRRKDSPGGVAPNLPAGTYPSSAPGAPAARPAPRSSLLDALKDELFQLETDRLQGRISQQEYEKAKAGLDMLFRRQIKGGETKG